MYLIFLVIAVLGYKRITADTKQSKGHDETVIGIKSRANFHALLILSMSYLLCWIPYSQWSTTVASFTQEIGISLSKYSLLWTINGALIVLGQPLLNGMLKLVLKSIKQQIIIGIGIFIVSFWVLSQAESFSGFLAAMAILTIAEMFVWPAVPTIAFDLAPKGREGFYQGIINSTATGGRMIGPLLGGVIVDLYSMGTLFIILIVLFMMAILAILVYDRKLKTAVTNAVQRQV